ncbi:Thiosulfate sulfurtransferase 16 [Ranunculus cassubicifolius]
MKRATSLVTSVVSATLRRHPHNINRYTQNPILTLQKPCQQLSKPHVHLLSSFRLMSTASSDTEKIDFPKSVSVHVAHDLHQAGHHYLDVRTPEEFNQGHPVGAVNIPYMFKAGDGMDENPDFLEEVSKHFEKNAKIIVGCRSGKRSLMAVDELSSAGFSGAIDIAGGYTAWRLNGFPTA